MSSQHFSEGTAALWSRLQHQENGEVGEIIAHDDLKLLQDDRIVFEKKVFQDLSIYKLLVFSSPGLTFYR